MRPDIPAPNHFDAVDLVARILHIPRCNAARIMSRHHLAPMIEPIPSHYCVSQVARPMEPQLCIFRNANIARRKEDRARRVAGASDLYPAPGALDISQLGQVMLKATSPIIHDDQRCLR